LTLECDVLVVGAGPAGSSAARAAAEGGAKTVFIEKKKEVGVPVQCAEAIGSYLIPYLPFKMPEDQLLWRIDGVSFTVDDITIERTGGIWSGYAINRERFDKWLAAEAVKAGAKLFLGTELVDLETEGEYIVTGARAKTSKGEMMFKPKVVVAADGVDSTVLKLLGFKIDLDKTGYVYGLELRGLSIQKPNFDHLFLGDFAPGGYGYVFPLSKDRANVGVAALFKKDSMEEFYEEFSELPEVKELLNGKGCAVKEKKGLVPFLSQTERWHYGNVLLAGDAANQNIKPFVEGFLPSIICGDLAGQSAVEHVMYGRTLNSYTKAVEERCREFLGYSDSLAKVAFELGKSVERKDDLLRVGLSSEIFSLEDLKYLATLSYPALKETLLKRYRNQ